MPASLGFTPVKLETWPPLPLEAWNDTRATLHMWLQIVGKVRRALSPPVNHWWNVALYVRPRGLTTSAIYYKDRSFEIVFDFIDHQLYVETSDGALRRIPLRAQPVAGFYREVMGTLRTLGIHTKIRAVPDEVPDPIPFDQDRVHATYDPEYAQRFWRILVSAAAVLEQFRARFVGKCSPVHFFWGSMDLAVTRFSGRPAPPREGADAITREAYSHEVSSAGFWPGGGVVDGAAFYAYAAPEPPGFARHAVRPAAAFYHPELKEFILRYDDFRQAPRPRQALLDFLQSTYEGAAILGHWDRAALER